ncbi:L-fucose:H+ symporter permease [Echinicola rosea]|uniref:MFS transporter n=1 Tax=Echinicola rosea TaxID=1807691 RepID=A0ABQ1UUI1_9BACT|nr:L-fucose:H+ symporter permease [Echinicola rosea]GGF25417.1 MFS transporter [Echinicola rosea]
MNTLKTVENTKVPLIREGSKWAFVVITSLFFMWGLANNMTDTLLAAFKRIMSMTDFQTSWIQLAFYGAYFLLALPAAIIIKKFTYKTGVVLGLGLFIAGALMFYPASITMQYGHFLVALFVLAGGLSILETTANPYIISMGNEDTGTLRLNLAQAFNPIGSITGVFLSKAFILSQLNFISAEDRKIMDSAELKAIQSEELTAVMGPYVGVALFLVVLWILIKVMKMPAGSDNGRKLHLKSSLKRLLRIPHYYWSVVAQFFYVGAQIGVWSFTIRYVMEELALNEDDASSYYLGALILFSFSRFIFTALMRVVSPQRLLMYAGMGAGISSLVVIFGAGLPAVIALVMVSGFMSLMFPTIYGIGLKGLGEDTKVGGSGLIMAILGGAVLTAVQGQVSDLTGSIKLSYFVPFVCFVVVAVFAYAFRKIQPKMSA